MTLTIKLVAVIAFASLSRTDGLTTFGKSRSNPTQRPVQPSEEPDSYQLYQTQIPVELELPRQEPNPVPFYAPEPVTFLKAPRESQEPDYYQAPIPNQELVAPIDTEWNPNNDPMYYYEVPAIITKQELPTQEFPKKFNEDIHEKQKPYSAKPKQEVIFEPISAQQYEEKQIQLAKIFDKLAKKENQKIIKVLPSRKIRIPIKKLQKEPKPTDSIPRPTHSTLKPRDSVPRHTHSIAKHTDSVVPTPTDSIPIPTLTVPIPTYYNVPTSTNGAPKPTDTILKPTDSVTISSDQVESASVTFDQGLSSQLTASLGIPSSAPTHDGASRGERLEFHMVGHDGPLSYKWGYDTGKGHNRLFRFEERNNEGVVKGHYGFYDKEGKLQVIHYDAHPHTGFHVSENS